MIDLQETVTAKLEVWLTRHPERLMTAEEAKLHNSLGSFGPTDANEARESSKQQSIARIPPPSERVSDSRLGASQLRATQESDDRLPIRRALNDEANNVSGPIAARLDKERQADTDPQKAHVGEFQGRQDKDRTLHQPSPSLQQATQPDLSSLSTVPSSLPALTNSSSLTAATLSTSSASTSKTSEPVRTPLTAVASSPSLDPAFATTVPLKILPKSRSVTPAKTTKLPSLGGEQPWSQNWTGINEALIR